MQTRFEGRVWTFGDDISTDHIIVAGANFGCGSSREQAPIALRTLGISAILANSFARIFFRNAINLGFPVIECPGLREKVNTGDTLELDMARGEIHLPGGVVTRFTPLPPNVLEILEAGGLVPKLRKELAAKSS